MNHLAKLPPAHLGLVALYAHPVAYGASHESTYLSVFAVRITFVGQQKNRLAAGFFHLSPGRDSLESSFRENDMSRPENTTHTTLAQPILTRKIGLLDTPITNTSDQLLCVEAGMEAQDALRAARTLSSGMSQLCQHMYDSLNTGEIAYCDGMAALCFLGETVSALIFSVEKGVAAAAGSGGEQ
ncbi:hypothetical protein [Pseudomonas mosselii]|uniref:hypothetical protein n=1 Tax=Pseudomonas mosselii TaxID=78327 RepID=UPI001E2B8497|nr:hypothetical protein [Pseudomonas mosselii]